MENIEELIKEVNESYELTVKIKQLTEDKLETEDLSDEKRDHYRNDLTDTERQLNDLDEDIIFLKNCNELNRITDEARYNKLKEDYYY